MCKATLYDHSDRPALESCYRILEAILANVSLQGRPYTLHYDTRVNMARIATSGDRRIRGLDSIRLFAAIWVAFSHGAAPPLKPFLVEYGWIGHLVYGGYGLLFNGVAAVIVFFLISGFCIVSAVLKPRLGRNSTA